MNKLFSILITAWDHQEEIRECLMSIVSQKFLNYEILVVCKDSSKDIVRILNEFSCSRLSLLSGKFDELSSARNEAVKKSQGRYLIFMNSYERMSENFLDECCRKALISKGRMILAGCKDLSQEANVLSTVSEKIYDAKIIKENRIRFKNCINSEALFNRDYLDGCDGVIFCPKAKKWKNF